MHSNTEISNNTLNGKINSCERDSRHIEVQSQQTRCKLINHSEMTGIEEDTNGMHHEVPLYSETGSENELYLDSPGTEVNEKFFKLYVAKEKQRSMMEDVLLAHYVTDSGLPNKFGCRIPLNTKFNITLLSDLLVDYWDREILEWLMFGFSVSRDNDAPDPVPSTTNHLGATLFPEAVDAYIEKEIRLGAMIGPFQIPPFIHRMGVLPLSTWPKRQSSERRIILDLSFPKLYSVNDGISKDWYCGKPIKLTYPNIDTLARCNADLGQNCRVWKLDLRCFFRQLPLCPRYFSLIGYRWCGLLFYDTSIPMGLRSAAYVAQRMTCMVKHIHGQAGFWCVNYLDDFGSAEEEHIAEKSFLCMRRLLTAIGIDEAKDKAVHPTARMEFLGNTVDTVKMTLEVSPERVEELYELLLSWENRKSFRKKELQSLIGKLSFMTNCIRPGRIFLLRLVDMLKDIRDEEHKCVTAQMRKDIRWWKEFLPEFDGVAILWLQDRWEPDTLLGTDASLIGGGAVHEEQFIHFKFPKFVLENTNNIAQREMLTILVAVRLWADDLAGKVVRIMTDSQVSMFAINNGKCKDEFVLQCLRELTWTLAKKANIIKSQVCRFEGQHAVRCIE